MKLLKDKVALITGGSRGIGRSICKSFAENGCSIAFTYNSSKESAETLIDELKEYNVKVKLYKSDASNYNDSIDLLETVVTDFEKIDILVNNAGITKDNLLMRMDDSEFKDVIDINLGSVSIFVLGNVLRRSEYIEACNISSPAPSSFITNTLSFLLIFSPFQSLSLVLYM